MRKSFRLQLLLIVGQHRVTFDMNRAFLDANMPLSTFVGIP